MNQSYEKRLRYITEALDEMKYALSVYRNAGKDAKYFYYAAQKKAEEVIETAITLNQDLIYERLDLMAKSYYNSFTDLDKLNILPIDELKKLASTAGFRNRLAHEYTNLDPQITVDSMEYILKLYPFYLEAMQTYLTK
ncbi:MAG: HepT-like ribonuclease domain-containing protein [Patescibacteria group bacterium]